MRGYVLQPYQVRARWGEISSLLAKAVAENQGEMDAADILQLVDNHVMFIGVIEDEGRILVALACEVHTYPKVNILQVSFIGGTPQALTRRKELYSELEGVAKLLKCSIIQGLCGPAAARYFSRVFGLKPVYTVLRKEVSP